MRRIKSADDVLLFMRDGAVLEVNFVRGTKKLMRNGVQMAEVSIEAWNALQGLGRKLAGTVESDETFIGGAAENMHAAKREKKIRGRGAVGKRIVHGLLERGGEVRAKVVESTEANELQPIIHRNVEPGANVYTDAHLSYQGLERHFIHEAVDHAQAYVRGQVHTNSLENFWSLFKRCLRGTWVSVAPFHLQRYVNEEVFRFNTRKGDDTDRFNFVMQHVPGRRITYRQLCELDGCGFMGLE